MSNILTQWAKLKVHMTRSEGMKLLHELREVFKTPPHHAFDKRAHFTQILLDSNKSMPTVHIARFSLDKHVHDQNTTGFLRP